MGVYNNYIIPKGATWDATVYWKDPNGNPINLTGYTAKLQISTQYGVSTSLELSSGNGITIYPTEGKLVITATPTQTGALAIGKYVYELELSVGTNIYRILEGELNVSNQVKSG